jgi:hypothetical protein
MQFKKWRNYPSSFALYLLVIQIWSQHVQCTFLNEYAFMKCICKSYLQRNVLVCMCVGLSYFLKKMIFTYILTKCFLATRSTRVLQKTLCSKSAPTLFHVSLSETSYATAQQRNPCRATRRWSTSSRGLCTCADGRHHRVYDLLLWEWMQQRRLCLVASISPQWLQAHCIGCVFPCIPISNPYWRRCPSRPLTNIAGVNGKVGPLLSS